MNETGENWMEKARLQPATAVGGLLSLIAVVSGLALVVFGRVEGLGLVVIGAVWASWIDHHKRPDDLRIQEMVNRLDSMQSKINSLQMRLGAGGN